MKRKPNVPKKKMHFASFTKAVENSFEFLNVIHRSSSSIDDMFDLASQLEFKLVPGVSHQDKKLAIWTTINRCPNHNATPPHGK